jgi:three-Cys-motif partner protein
MKNKWTRVYVDLYAGSGLCRIKGRDQVLLGSPLIALSVDAPFDRYIFCESDPERFSALKSRVEKNYAKHNVHLVAGKFEEHINDICSKIPGKSLVLCFVDPFDCDFDIDNLKTISKCARGVDFLCLLALQMDAKRNVPHYLQLDSKIDRMIGNTTWRTRWNERTDIHEDFAKFLAREFAQSLSEVEYLETPLHQMREVKTLDKNVPLYYLAMFSKNQTAFKLWAQVLKYSNKAACSNRRSKCHLAQPSNGPTPPGIRCAAARKSAPAVRTATPNDLRSVFAEFQVIPLNKASTFAWYRKSSRILFGGSPPRRSLSIR